MSKVRVEEYMEQGEISLDRKIKLGIIARFSALKTDKPAYLLGDWLEANGIEVTLLDLAATTLGAQGELRYEGKLFPPVDAILWRVDEGLISSTELLLNAMDDKYHMINPLGVIWLCSNKLLTHDTLLAQGIPHVSTQPVFPGNELGYREIAKPQFGSKGRDFVHCGERVPYNAVEPYVKQEYLGSWEDFLQVLVVAGKPIITYQRVENENHEPKLGHDLYDEVIVMKSGYAKYEKIALQAASGTQAIIAGVDIHIPTGQVLEVNSVPHIPRVLNILERTSTEVANHLKEVFGVMTDESDDADWYSLFADTSDRPIM